MIKKVAPSMRFNYEAAVDFNQSKRNNFVLTRPQALRLNMTALATTRPIGNDDANAPSRVYISEM